MTPILKGQLAAASLLLPLLLAAALLDSAGGQTIEQCVQDFKQGREDFILDTDESVKEGATYLVSPRLNRYRDCVAACCKDARCNVALMERGAEEGSINSCFLFDCLYKKKYVCRFARKKGFLNFIRDSVYESYLAVDLPPNDSDRPPVADGGPDRVVQPQDTVTLNGLQSRDDIKIASYQWTMVTPYPFAVIEKTNHDDEIIVSNLTSGVYKFQLTVTDSIGQSDTTKVTVLVLTPEQSEHHCMAPMKIGPCRGSFPRWHYNAASEKCEKFEFGGCRENLNNYISESECTNACEGSDKIGKSGRLLPLPETQTEKCGAPCTAKQFTCANGCCLDPGLECDKIPQCTDGSDEQSCEDLNNNFEILRQIPVDERKVRCTESPQTGTCRDGITKWYYNPMKQECTIFNYGGCQGNDNRFDTEQQCLKTCQGVTEKDVFARNADFERRESDSKTGIFAGLAILAVAIFIMLIVLLYCFMKGRKKSSQHQRVPVNTIPVTYEDRERLVYNSTTKPM